MKPPWGWCLWLWKRASTGQSGETSTRLVHHPKFDEWINSLKLAVRPLDETGWKMNQFPFGMAYFQGRTVGLRECTCFSMRFWCVFSFEKQTTLNDLLSFGCSIYFSAMKMQLNPHVLPYSYLHYLQRRQITCGQQKRYSSHRMVQKMFVRSSRSLITIGSIGPLEIYKDLDVDMIFYH